MQSVSSRIWTRVVVSISYDDNCYTTGTSLLYFIIDAVANIIFAKTFELLFFNKHFTQFK